MTPNLHVCTICCRPEVDNDVISGAAVDNLGMDVPIKFGDSSSKGFRDIPGADFVSNIAEAYIPIARSVSPKNCYRYVISVNGKPFGSRGTAP